MVYENIAKIYCEICGKFIKEAVVISPSKDLQIKVSFDICEDCKREFYRYNDLGLTYEYAKILVYKSFVGKSEKDRLKEYIRSQHLIFDPLLEDRKRKREPFGKILRDLREKLRLLSRSTEEVLRIINKYKDRIGPPPPPPPESPAKRFEVFIYRKVKRSLA